MTVKGIYVFVSIVAAEATPNFGATAICTSIAKNILATGATGVNLMLLEYNKSISARCNHPSALNFQ